MKEAKAIDTIKEHISDGTIDPPKKGLDPANRVFFLKDGFAWNPLKSYPRNAPCVCRSGKKFKKCCMDKISPVCSDQDAKYFQALVNEVKKVLKEKQ